MAIRSAMHQAGAAALSQLLEFDPPGPEERKLACGCGQEAKYLGLRSKAVLTVVGQAQCLRPYYFCEHCHHGWFPLDVDLDMEDTEFSPGVRRMLAAVGHQMPFEQGQEQMKLLAGLTVTVKAVERTAEVIGADIEVGQQQQLSQAMQLSLPIPPGTAHSRSLCGDGRHGHSGGAQGNQGAFRQTGGGTRTHAGSQTRLCIRTDPSG